MTCKTLKPHLVLNGKWHNNNNISNIETEKFHHLLKIKMTVILRQPCTEKRHGSVGGITIWARKYSQTIACEYSSSLHPEMQDDTPCKEETVHKPHPETLHFCQGQIHGWWIETRWKTLVGSEFLNSWTLEFSTCYQHTLQHPVLSWYGGAVVHMAPWVSCTFVKAPLMLNDIQYTGFGHSVCFEHTLPVSIFLGLAHLNKAVPNYILQYYNSMAL